MALSCCLILSLPNLLIPNVRSPLGIWKLTSDSPSHTRDTTAERPPPPLDWVSFSPPTLPAPKRPFFQPVTYHQNTKTRGYGEEIIQPEPSAPPMAMPKSQLLSFRNLNVDGDGSPEGDESSSEESLGSPDENIGPERSVEQPAHELPIGLDAESLDIEDRTLKNLLSLLAKSFKDSPVGHHPRMA